MDEEDPRLERLAREVMQIRSALGRVSAYEGIVDVSPTAMLVDDLVRDYAELEARIDAAFHLLAAAVDDDESDEVGLSTITRDNRLRWEIDQAIALLAGGKRVPDSPEGLTG